MDATAFEDFSSSFPVADLSAKLEWKSASSAGFLLGNTTNILQLEGEPEPVECGSGGVFDVKGELEVHHPCEGHIRLRLRFTLPSAYHTAERMAKLVSDVKLALLIDEDEIFDVVLVASDQMTSMSNREDTL